MRDGEEATAGELEKPGGSVHSGINHLTACECVGRWEQHNTVQHKHLSSQGATGKCLVVLTDSCRGKKNKKNTGSLQNRLWLEEEEEAQ